MGFSDFAGQGCEVSGVTEMGLRDDISGGPFSSLGFVGKVVSYGVIAYTEHTPVLECRDATLQFLSLV